MPLVPRPPPPRHAGTTSTLSLHVGDTTIALPFGRDQAQQLSDAFVALFQTFAAKQKAERPKRWDMMEVRFVGQAPQELAHFEAFCNPNAYTTAFDAKVLLTIQTHDGVKVTTEARLSAIKADVDAFLS